MNLLSRLLFSTTILSGLLLIVGTGNCQVVINEFSASNYSHFGFGNEWDMQFEDWIELHNTGEEPADISGFHLSDNLNNPTRWAIPDGTIIPPGAFEVFLLSGEGDFNLETEGHYHANFKWKQTYGEDIVFADAGGVVLENYSFSELGVTQRDHSFARNVDGVGEWRICSTPTPEESNEGEFFVAYAQKPYLTINPGWYLSDLALELFTDEEGITMYYSLDGSEPSDESQLYFGPIVISETAVLRAIAYSNDPTIYPSFIETNTYFVNQDEHDLPMISISGTTLSDGSWSWESEPTTLEYFNASNQFICEANGDSDKHGHDTNAFNQRGFDFVTHDEFGYDHHVEAGLFQTTDRTEFQRLIFKAGGYDNYQQGNGAHIRDHLLHTMCQEADLNVDARSASYCVVYINGDYWGLYVMEEKVDDLDYFEHYYDQHEGHVDFLKTWGGTWAEYGDISNWQEVVDFQNEESLCEGDNYDWMSSQIDMSSLIDFFVLQTFSVNTQYLNWDQAWWRGQDPQGGDTKWRYALWGMSHTFGHGVNYLGLAQTGPESLPCEVLNTLDPGGAGHVPLWNSLLENPDFKDQLVARYLELNSSNFSCENLNALIDSLQGVFASEMERHVNRWGGSVEGWFGELEELHEFVDARCGNTMEALINECWDFSVEDSDLTVIINGQGLVDVNGVVIDDSESPFVAEDCSNVFQLQAMDGVEVFSHWELISGQATIDDPNDPYLELTITEPVTVQANFDVADNVALTPGSAVMIFPNPTSGLITISSDTPLGQLLIRDEAGRVVKALNGLGNKVLMIDLEGLSIGVYYIENQTNERFNVIKLFIQK